MRYCILFLTLLLTGCSPSVETTPAPVVAVKVVRVRTADIQITVRAPATVFPREQANIAARITAPIRELRVHKGDAVAANQVLAVLESRDIAAQREEARAALTDAEANLQKLVAGTLPTDVERARGQVATTQAALNQAQTVYDRRAELFHQGAIPGRDLLTSQTELAQAKSNYEVARRSLELLESRSRESDIRMAKSRVEQARARESAAEAQLQYAELRSPFAGTVTEQFQYPGDMAKPDSPVFTVMDLSTAIARAQVPEEQIAGVRERQACAFDSIDTAAGAGGGSVTVVNRAVDPARRTVEVWCSIPNSGARLRAGLYGNLTILTGSEPQSLVLPVAAVEFVEGTRTGSAYVVDAHNIAHRTQVETGGQSGGAVRITSGLKAGDVVIVQGGYGLPDGTQVRITGEEK